MENSKKCNRRSKEKRPKRRKHTWRNKLQKKKQKLNVKENRKRAKKLKRGQHNMERKKRHKKEGNQV